MQFRQKALAKMREPTELDAPIQLAPPKTALVLAVLVVVVVGGAFWASVGELPRKTTAAGILTRMAGSFILQSPVAGQITNVFVSQGGSIPTGIPMMSVRVNGRTELIRSATAGRVTALFAKQGQVIAPGKDLAVIERIDDKNDRLVAVLYVPTGPGGEVRKGSDVDITVESAPSREYGVLRGRVTSISQFSETRQQIADFLGDEELGARFGSAQPLKVVVDLLTEPATASGFKWSTRKGPPYRIDSRTLVFGAIHLTPVRPIQWVTQS